MGKSPLNKGVLTENFTGIGPATREMGHARVCELASIAGPVPPHVTQGDYEPAECELTGGSDLDRRETVLASLPETERWDPVPGSTGRQATESRSEDEDEEARSKTEQLVDAGVEEAGREQMPQAARAAEKTEPSQP